MPAPAKVPPSQVTQLRTTSVAATRVALVWRPPTTGTLPIGYTVFMRPFGGGPWAVAATSEVPSAIVTNLHPGTRYEFEVMAHNR